MARVTVEDCLEKVPNRFALTVLAAKRARLLSEGKARPLVQCDNKDAVVALREIAAGKVRFAEDVDEVLRSYVDEQKHQYMVTSSDWGYVEAADLSGLADDEDLVEADADDLDELPSDPTLLGKRAKADLDETESDDAVASDDEEADEGAGDDDALLDDADDFVVGAVSEDDDAEADPGEDA